MTGLAEFWAIVLAQPPCPICAAEDCPDPAGCVVAYQAECAAHGLPPLDTGGQT